MLDSIRLRLSTHIPTIGIIETDTDIEQTKEFIDNFRHHSIGIYNKLKDYSFDASHFVYKEISSNFMAIETSLHEFSINVENNITIEVYDKKIGEVVRFYLLDEVIDHISIESLSEWFSVDNVSDKYKALSTILFQVITKKILK